MRKNLNKFARFEKELFDLEANCMLERVRKYYIRKLKLPADFSFSSVFENEKILTLLHILATNHTNTEVGKKLLFRVAKYHKASKENPRFRSQKNDDWLLSHLPPAQKKTWLARNEKIYEVTEEDRKTDKSTEWEIEKFVSVAKKLLEDVEYSGNLDFSSYETFCTELPDFLEQNPEFDPKFAKDLRSQKDSIERILLRKKSRSVDSVKIYRETDPLRVIMMGDWVDGSCLASYSSIRNSWSTIANACEVNKAVFYAEDEKGNIIGRVLMAIDEENRLVPFKVYTRGNPDVDLTRMFEKYLREFSQAA